MLNTFPDKLSELPPYSFRGRSQQYPQVSPASCLLMAVIGSFSTGALASVYGIVASWNIVAYLLVAVVVVISFTYIWYASRRAWHVDTLTKPVVFVTGNRAKAEQLGLHLAHKVDHRDFDLPEIQSLSLEEVAVDKARRASALLQAEGTDAIVLVEDTSLVFHGFGELPGPFIKWFLNDIGNEGLCDLVSTDRRATAEVMFVLCYKDCVRTYHAKMEGTVALQPVGDKGFGWDPIFVPDGHTLTWGQMDADTQKATSMRRHALADLTEDIEKGLLVIV